MPGKRGRVIFKRALVLALVFLWGIAGWPAVWNSPRIPPKVTLVFAASTATNSPSTSTGGWTNPTNAYADGTNYVNITSGAPSATETYGGYGFNLTGSTITQVRVRLDASSVGGATVTTANKLPAGDDSNTGGFTTAPLWSKVNDNNDTTTITGVTNAGGRATFSFTAFAIPAGSAITNVTVYFRHKDASSGTNKAGASLKVNGVYYDNGGLVEPGAAFATNSNSWTTNPNTGAAWTVDDINGVGAAPLQAFGVSSNDFNPDVLFSEVYATVTYTTANDETIETDVSWDGGTTWSASKHQQALTGTETTYWIDVTGDTSWTATKLNDTNFKVKVDGLTVGDSGDVRLDWIPVEVSYLNLPTVTTQAATNVSATTATANGDLTNSGGENNDKEGFVYDTASKSLPGNVAPASSGYANSAENTGSFAAGPFTVSLINLTSGVTYYGRAYSHNSVGYSYGGEVSFTPVIVAISITTDGAVSYGLLPAGNNKDTTAAQLNDTQTGRNDGTGTETFNIKTSNATGGTQWTLGSSAGSDIFVHEFSTNGGGVWTKFTTPDSYQTLATGIAASGTQNFDLRVTVPTVTTDYQQKSITVTVQAVAQ